MWRGRAEGRGKKTALPGLAAKGEPSTAPTQKRITLESVPNPRYLRKIQRLSHLELERRGIW